MPADKAPDRLAVWALNVEHINLFREIKLIQVPGSNNVNLAAQSGVFTLLKQGGVRGECRRSGHFKCAGGVESLWSGHGRVHTCPLD